MSSSHFVSVFTLQSGTQSGKWCFVPDYSCLVYTHSHVQCSSLVFGTHHGKGREREREREREKGQFVHLPSHPSRPCHLIISHRIGLVWLVCVSVHIEQKERNKKKNDEMRQWMFCLFPFDPCVWFVCNQPSFSSSIFFVCVSSFPPSTQSPIFAQFCFHSFVCVCMFPLTILSFQFASNVKRASLRQMDWHEMWTIPGDASIHSTLSLSLSPSSLMMWIL